MNVERMLQLAEAIENNTLSVDFNMAEFSTCRPYLRVGENIPCGTACCIAGWAVLLFGNRGELLAHDTARRALELNFFQADRLFYNGECYISRAPMSEITRDEAVAAIRRMAAETGK